MDGVGVTADGFGLRGPRGWVFRGIGVDAEPGSLIAVKGPSGSGRTSLLLALTGRMKATEGTATVGGARLPKQSAAVRRVGALAHVAGVTDLDPALTVGEHLRERALLERRFGGSVRELLRPRAERAAGVRLRVDAALSAAGLDQESLPKGPRTAVRDLERLEALRLSVALALIGRPGLLGVDDVDLKLADAEREDAWALLRSLAEAGTTVLAVCGEAPEGAVVVSTGSIAVPDASTGTAPSTQSVKPSEPTEPSEPAEPNEPSEPAGSTPSTGTEQEEEKTDAIAETGRP
ncbi:ATP-binding cassette domain-containing protein [Streptomyces sp. NPDC005476]|uniref:ATP-binding cassette domain-containing protein n=1 Tax=Streptomyces sp. NPDC005476 TaxID=3156882 RepID=UPI003454C1E5